jgi:hypothetical protein
MHRTAFVGAVVLVGVGVVLGATVFRTDIAQATGLAQSVTVNNTAADPVPVREQNLDANGNVRVAVQGAIREARTDITFSAESNTGFLTDCGNNSIYQVPAGQQLVAQFMSIDSAVETDTATADQATLYNADQSGAIDVAGIALTRGTLDRWVGSQTIDVVFPSGATLGFNTQPDVANQCDATITVGGYLEPTP